MSITPASEHKPANAFHGRRKGKALRDGQSQLMGGLLPVLKLDLSTPAPQDLRTLFPVPVTEIRLEIGFGGAEHLIHRAKESPSIGFIGVEPFVNGMAKALAAIEREGLRNIRLFDDDAAFLLDWLPESSLTGVDLFYPDPWPKARHWKRRFVSDQNVARIARALKPGALWRFASDIPHYVAWTLLHARRAQEFIWTAERADHWRLPYEGWPGTRYEAKALREGRVPAYLAFVREERGT